MLRVATALAITADAAALVTAAMVNECAAPCASSRYWM
jgi:hypothetical protein